MHLRRPEKPGDRARRLLYVHGEAMRPEFVEGQICVEAKRPGTARALISRHGFSPYEPAEHASSSQAADGGSAEPAGGLDPAEAQEGHSAATRKELLADAKALRIRGRTKMSNAELLDAIQAAAE